MKNNEINVFEIEEPIFVLQIDADRWKKVDFLYFYYHGQDNLQSTHQNEKSGSSSSDHNDGHENDNNNDQILFAFANSCPEMNEYQTHAISIQNEFFQQNLELNLLAQSQSKDGSFPTLQSLQIRNTEQNSMHIRVNYQCNAYYSSNIHHFITELISADNLTEELQNQLITKGPTHIIKIYKTDNSSDNRKESFYCAIGCMLKTPLATLNFKDFFAKLLNDMRYSQPGIIHQVRDRISEQIIFKAFKDVIRLLHSISDIENQNQSLPFIQCLNQCVNKNIQSKLLTHDTDLMSLKNEICNVIYKNLITEGLFPIYVELNTMNKTPIAKCQEILLNLISKAVISSNVVPWSTKFHTSLLVAGYKYSFTQNDNLNCLYLRKRKVNKNYHYLKIKLLDFFPQDTWIELLVTFFIDNTLDLMCFYLNEEAQFQQQPSQQQCMDLNDLDQNQKQNHQFQIPINNQYYTPQPINLNNSEYFNNAQSDIWQASSNLCKNSFSNNKPHINSFSNIKPNNLDQSQSQIFQNQKVFDTKRQKQIISDIVMGHYFDNNCAYNQAMNKLTAKIASDFYETYVFELVHTNILYKLCQIKVETEFKKYSYLKNNCQTPVSEFVHFVREALKPVIEPLPKYDSFFDTSTLIVKQLQKGDPFTLNMTGFSLIQMQSCLQIANKINHPDKQESDLTTVIEGDIQTQTQKQHQKASCQKQTISNARFAMNQDINEDDCNFNSSHFIIQKQVQQVILTFLKFSSASTIIRFLQTQSQSQPSSPCVLDVQLDHLGIYGDQLLNDYLHQTKVRIDLQESHHQLKRTLNSYGLLTLFKRFKMEFQTQDKVLAQVYNQAQAAKKSYAQKIEEIEPQQAMLTLKQGDDCENKPFLNQDQYSLTDPLLQSPSGPPSHHKRSTISNVGRSISNLFQSVFSSRPKLINNNINAFSNFINTYSDEQMETMNRKNAKSNEGHYEKRKNEEWQIKQVTCFLMFIIENELVRCRHIPTKKQEYHQFVQLYKELAYVYYNSIRFKNAYKHNRNTLSYIGCVLIKDPTKIYNDRPDNFHLLNLLGNNK